MPESLRQLQEDHRNMARLLRALERQIALFDRAERPDYDILLSIAEYFTGFPDRCHHPKEDVVLRKMRARDPEATAALARLESEHARLGELAVSFQQALQNVLKEAEVPRGNIDRVVRTFIDGQREHMQKEEQHFFPLALALLTPDDWAEVEAETGNEDDPLFGPKVAAQYAALRDDILRWEREDQVSKD